MLVLTRTLGQRVVINPGLMSQVTVSVERLSSGEVRLGFTAPRATVIEREEVWRGQARRPIRRVEGAK